MVRYFRLLPINYAAVWQIQFDAIRFFYMRTISDIVESPIIVQRTDCVRLHAAGLYRIKSDQFAQRPSAQEYYHIISFVPTLIR